MSRPQDPARDNFEPLGWHIEGAHLDGTGLPQPISYIFLAFYRFYLSPGFRTSGTPGEVLTTIKKEQRD